MYEKEVKSYVYTLEGAPATTKMQLPKDARMTCMYTCTICSKILNTSFFLFSTKMSAFGDGIHKMLVRIRNIQKQSDLGVHCLSM